MNFYAIQSFKARELIKNGIQRLRLISTNTKQDGQERE